MALLIITCDIRLRVRWHNWVIVFTLIADLMMDEFYTFGPYLMRKNNINLHRIISPHFGPCNNFSYKTNITPEVGNFVFFAKVEREKFYCWRRLYGVCGREALLIWIKVWTNHVNKAFVFGKNGAIKCQTNFINKLVKRRPFRNEDIIYIHLELYIRWFLLLNCGVLMSRVPLKNYVWWEWHLFDQWGMIIDIRQCVVTRGHDSRWGTSAVSIGFRSLITSCEQDVSKHIKIHTSMSLRILRSNMTLLT